ncbi:LOW QUALITY PROTEIN: leukocyte tyrosine kinase receptor [Megaptera novaeangliae]
MGAILCSSLGSQAPFPPSSPLPLPVPSPWDLNITTPPSHFEPASPLIPPGTEGRWLFSTCRASSRGPTQCGRDYTGSSVVVSGAAGPLKGVQLWWARGAGQYLISAYGAAGGKGAKNHLSPAPGVFLFAVSPLGRGELPYILVGQQGEDACPRVSGARSQESQLVCLGESPAAEEHAATEGIRGVPGSRSWAGVGADGGAAAVFRLRARELEPLLVAAGGGGRAYLRRQDRGRTQATPEKLQNRSAAPGSSGRGGAAGGGDGWTSRAHSLPAGRSPREGAESGQGCREAWATLGWGDGGGHPGSQTLSFNFQGGDASETDILWADGEDGVSFIHPNRELYLQPLPDPLILMVAVMLILTLRLPMVCGVLILVNHKKWQGLWWMRLPGPELQLSKLTSTIRTTPSPYYFQVGLAQSWPLPPGLTEVSHHPLTSNLSSCRALGHGAFGEVYEGLVIGLPGDPSPLQVTIKTLPELCSQDQLDFLMETIIRYTWGQGQAWKMGGRHPELPAQIPLFTLGLRGSNSRDTEVHSSLEPRAWFLSLLVMGYVHHWLNKVSHQKLRCVGLSIQAAPGLILLELMSGGDMKSFLRHRRPQLGQPSPLAMQDLLQLAWDIAQGCHYLEENHFIHRDIAARNCLPSCTRPSQMAKTGDFGMASTVYRASYGKGSQVLLPVKMPPEACLEGIFTSKTDSWSFGVLLWKISLDYMPYPWPTDQEVLDFVIGGWMDPLRGCPRPVYHIMTQCWQHQLELHPSFASILEVFNSTQNPDVLNSPLPVELGPILEEEGAGEPISLGGLRCPQTQEPSPGSLKSWGGSLLGPGLKPSKSRGLQPQNLWNPTYGSWVPKGPEGEDSGTEGSSSSLHSSPGF